ncbi:unnamed protein product [Caretta caretta]
MTTLQDEPLDAPGPSAPTVPPKLPEPPMPMGASSSPDDILIPVSLSPPDDHAQYQSLLHRKATAFNLPAEDVQDPQDQFLDILQPPGSPPPSHAHSFGYFTTGPDGVAHASLLCPKRKRAEHRYFVPSKGTDFLFTHPPLKSLIINAATARALQQHFKSTSPARNAKKRLAG